MNKRFAGLFVAMLLIFTMGTTVFAADFPSPGNTTGLEKKAQEWNRNVTSVSARGDNNNIITVTQKTATAEQVSAANTVAKEIDEGAEIMAMSDLSVPDGTDTSKGVKITLSVSGVKSGDRVYVLHQLSNGSWETLSATVSGGKVTVTLYSFSPVVIVKYPAAANVPVSDPSKNQSGSNTSNTENNNSNNTTGDTQNNSQSNSQNNNNNQSNSQTNNQNNPVNVDQNVTVNYPDVDKDGSYDKGYSDGYKDGADSSKGNSNATATSVQTTGSTVSVNTATSPKTGAALPALPVIAVFALAGIAVCGKKAHNQ